MSAGLAALQQWADRMMCEALGGVTVHLYGLGNEEIGGGGYASQPMNSDEPQRFVFTGQTPKIYGYYLQAGGQKIYSESFPQPWQALNAGDAVTVSITIDVKTKHKG